METETHTPRNPELHFQGYRRVAGGVDLVKKTWNGGDLFPKLTEVGSRLELGDKLGNGTRR